MVREETLQPGEARAPECQPGGAGLGSQLGPVVGMGILRAPIGMMGKRTKKVEVDAVHGFRPVSEVCFRIAMKRGMIRIRKIHGT